MGSRTIAARSSLFARIFGLDLQSLAAFRVALALFVLYDLASRAADLTAHYSDAGVFPRSAAWQYFAASPIYRQWNPTVLSLHMLSGSTLVVALIFLLHGAAAAALLVGHRTRLMTFIVWFLVCSLHTRNPLVLSVGDDVLRVLLFFSIFLPLASKVPGLYASPASVLFYLQFIAIYFFSALLKSGPEWRTQGMALYFAFHFDQFALPLGKSLLLHPQFLRVLSLAVWWIELLGTLILLLPYRVAKTAGVLLMAGLQIGIASTLALGHNPWINLIALIPFVPWPGRSAAVQRRRLHWYDAPAAFLLAGVLVYNAAWILPLEPLKAVFEFPILLTRLEQYWGMFAPAPSREDGWYVVAGRLTGGMAVEAFRRQEVVNYDKPLSAAAFYPNERWRRYLMNIGTRDFKDFRLPFAQYICRDWNAANAADRHLEQVQVFFVRETTPPPSAPQAGVERLTFFDYHCLP